MLDVAASPNFAQDGWIYLAFSDQLEGEKMRAMLKIVRGRIREHVWTDEEVIFQSAPDFYTPAGQHFGTRMAFESGYFYFIVGERGGKLEAQDLTRPNGKIYRVFPDGRIPEDNPFAADKTSIPGIWSYGHRNPQGLAIDPRDHAIYATEHGPRGGDEFNLIRKGANYGWPVISHGMNYDGPPPNRAHRKGRPGATTCAVDAIDRSFWPHLLHWRQISRLEIRLLRRRPARGTSPHPGCAHRTRWLPLHRSQPTRPHRAVGAGGVRTLRGAFTIVGLPLSWP